MAPALLLGILYRVGLNVTLYADGSLLFIVALLFLEERGRKWLALFRGKGNVPGTWLASPLVRAKGIYVGEEVGVSIGTWMGISGGANPFRCVQWTDKRIIKV